MKKISRAIAYAIYLAGLLLIFLLPANRYEWMQDIEPDMPASAIEDASGNSALFAFLLLAVISIAQLALIIRAKTGFERMFSVVLVLFALFVCAAKFW